MRIKHFLWMFPFAALVACGTAPAKGADGAAQTQIVATFAAQLTQTAVSAPIEIEPDEPPTGTMTESPEETETPFVTPTLNAGTLLLGKFRSVTVSNGNLFVRDGTGVPVQITKSGKDHDPVISDDGKKIVFYRGDDVFVIHADGSNEKALINKQLMPALGTAKVELSTFRAATHELFFSTRSCTNADSFCLATRFFVNVDTGKIEQFVADFSNSSELSPDGQYFSTINAGKVDLHSIDGKLIHSTLIKVTTGIVLPLQYWLPDSSGLLAIASNNTLPNTYTIWRYRVKENLAEQIKLVPAIATSASAACLFALSPDRSWILYQDSQQKSYLGNLKTSQVQAYNWDGDCSVKWSKDSLHFASQTAIGSVDGTPPIKLDGHFIAWIDATHYLLSKGKNVLDLQTYVAEVGKESAAVPVNFIWSPVYAVLP